MYYEDMICHLKIMYEMSKYFCRKLRWTMYIECIIIEKSIVFSLHSEFKNNELYINTKKQIFEN